MFAPDKVGL